MGLGYLQARFPNPHVAAPGNMQKQLLSGGRASEMAGTREQSLRQLLGGRTCHPLLTNALAVFSLVLASGYCYILEIFAHSLNQSTFMEHMLFVENLFVNSTILTTNLFIKCLLSFINFLIHSFVLSNELTSRHILNTYRLSYSYNQSATKYLLFDHPFVQSINKPPNIY